MKYLVPTVFVLIAALALVGCAKKRPLTPVTPWADVANDSLCFFTVGTDPEDLRVCYVFDWGDGDTTTTNFAKSGDTSWCSHEFSGTAVRYITVKARNEKGAESDWSPCLKFHPSQLPQLVDTIVGLRRWTTDRWYHASVRVTDADGDSVAVKFVWGDLPAAGWSAFVPSGSVIADSCRWTTTGPHAVTVVLRDKGCMVCRPSEVKMVGISSMAVLWHNYDKERSYYATPTLGSIDGEPVLYCGNDEYLDCYYLDGRLRWSVPMSDGCGYAPSLSPDGSRLYLTEYGYGLVCLDARSGQRKWTMDAGWCTPSVGPGGAIYVAEGDGLSRVRDCGDSAVVEWSVRPGGYDWEFNGPVVGRNGVAYPTGYDGHGRSMLVAVDSAGSVLWADSTSIQEGGAPVIDSRDRVLVTDWVGYVYCFNPGGTLTWGESTSELWPGCTAVGWNDEVIVTTYDGRVMDFDSTGRRLWVSTGDFDGGNTPCVAQDGTIIMLDYSGTVYGIGSEGQTLWEFSTWDSLNCGRRRSNRDEGDECPSPVIGPNGDLYIACSDGLACLALGGLRMANTAWPTYNHDAARSGWAGRP